MKTNLTLNRMKKVYVLILLACLTGASRAQLTCNSAVNITPTTTCNYSSYTTNGTDFWLKFVATSKNVNISLITTQFGSNATHIHDIQLRSGSCGLQTVIAEDELPFVSSADKLAIDLDASNLTLGSTYYIKVSRLAPTGTCDKGTCTAAGSTNPSNFFLCIQNINVIIPLDFGIEPPAIGRGYVRNRGQLTDNFGNPRPEIKLYNTNTTPAVYIADNFISYAFVKIDTIPTTDTMHTHRVDMTLVGGSAGTRVFKSEEAPGATNYYLAHIPKGVTNTKSYYRSVTNDVYNKIDMQWYSNNVGEKFYFIVRPGGDPNDIVLKYDGATSVTALANGGLKVVTPMGNIEYEPPHAYLINPGNNVVPMPWQAKFVQVTSNSVKFQTHNYSQNMPMFIQVDKGHLAASPSSTLNLDWSTYVGGNASGGNGDDIGMDVKTDISGNVYMTGHTGSTNFPFLVGAATQTVFSGYYDAFVSKFDSQAKFLWSTYYGGINEERGLSLLTSQDGFIYFTGLTKSGGFPTADNTGVSPYNQTFFGGEQDGFIVSLNPNGSLRWGTFYGGYTRDVIHKITEDNLGNLIICGSVAYQDLGLSQTIVAGTPLCVPPSGNGGFPACANITPAYYRNVHSGGVFDAFIAKLNPNRQLNWSTFFGGSGSDVAYDVIVNPSDNSIYITGYTESTTTGNNSTTSPCNVPTNNGFPMCDLGGGAYYQNTYPGIYTKAYVAKFSSANQLLWNTFFGSAGAGQVGQHLALNSNGDLYFVGKSGTGTGIPLPSPSCATPTNGGFPLCNPGGGAYYRDNNNASVSNDAFITRFNAAGQIIWSSFYGGSGDEDGLFSSDGTINVSISSNNKVFIIGCTQKVSGNGNINVTQYPGFYYQPNNVGSGTTRDAYIACFDENNVSVWATNFGGGGAGVNASDLGHGLAIDNANSKLYITGGTVSQTFPTTCPIAPMPYCIGTINDAGQGWYDAYIARFSLNGLVGIHEYSNQQNSFLIYPNPTSGNVIISLGSEIKEKVEIRVYNALGQLQISETVKKSGENFTHELDCKNFAHGIYFINIYTGKQILSQKLIKN